jgi:hypothetical protein
MCSRLAQVVFCSSVSKVQVSTTAVHNIPGFMVAQSAETS